MIVWDTRQREICLSFVCSFAFNHNSKMDPLALLRTCNLNGKLDKVVLKDDRVEFEGKHKFPKKTLTSFKYVMKPTLCVMVYLTLHVCFCPDPEEERATSWMRLFSSLNTKI